jgi:hypothetical protein
LTSPRRQKGNPKSNSRKDPIKVEKEKKEFSYKNDALIDIKV